MAIAALSGPALRAAGPGPSTVPVEGADVFARLVQGAFEAPVPGPGVGRGDDEAAGEEPDEDRPAEASDGSPAGAEAGVHRPPGAAVDRPAVDLAVAVAVAPARALAVASPPAAPEGGVAGAPGTPATAALGAATAAGATLAVDEAPAGRAGEPAEAVAAAPAEGAAGTEPAPDAGPPVATPGEAPPACLPAPAPLGPAGGGRPATGATEALVEATAARLSLARAGAAAEGASADVADVADLANVADVTTPGAEGPPVDLDRRAQRDGGGHADARGVAAGPAGPADPAGVAGAVPAAPGSGPAAATAPGGDAGAPGAVPPPPWEQVADLVRGARRFADGSHRLSVSLEPGPLGQVHVELTVLGGRLSMVVTADSAAAREQLQRSLPELRATLEASGVPTAALELGHDRADTRGGQPGHDGSLPLGLVGAAPRRGPTTSTSSEPHRGPRPTRPGDRRLDLRL